MKNVLLSRKNKLIYAELEFKAQLLLLLNMVPYNTRTATSLKQFR